MSESQVEVQQPAPQAASVTRPRRTAAVVPSPVANVAPPAEPAAAAAPSADVGAPAEPKVDGAQPPAPVADAPPSATPRATAAPITVPWESNLPGVTSGEIRAELARRQRRIPKLMAERALVIQQMEAIEEALDSIGEDVPEIEVVAAPGEQWMPRARNAVSLKDAIAGAVPAGATVSPAEVTESVRKSGYTSTAANFGQMVASMLAKDGRFERVGRGRYRKLAG